MRREQEPTLTMSSGFGTPLARRLHDYQCRNRNEIRRIASSNNADNRERVSANIEIAPTQIVFGNEIIRSAIATGDSRRMSALHRVTADMKLRPLASTYESHYK